MLYVNTFMKQIGIQNGNAGCGNKGGHVYDVNSRRCVGSSAFLHYRVKLYQIVIF